MSVSTLRRLVRNFPENGPKLLLLENPANVRDLLHLVHEPAAASIDFTRMTVERTHFVQSDFAHVTLDLLLKAPFQDRTPIWIYILVEHQSQPERFFVLRLAEYLIEAYKMQKQAWSKGHAAAGEKQLYPVLPVVLYTGDRAWDRVESLSDLIVAGDRFRALIPSFKTHFLNLRDTPTQTLTHEGGFFGQVLRLIQRQRGDAGEFRQTLVEVMSVLEGMTVTTSEQRRWVDFLSYVLALVYHARREEEHPELRDVVDRAVQTETHRKEYGVMGRTIAEMFLDEGAAKGALQQSRTILLRLLRQRFKKVPRTVQARITSSTNMDDLNRWIDNVYRVPTLDDVGID